MADPANPIHGRRLKPPVLLPAPAGRAWSMDDIVVVVFALLGIGGAVFLPLRFQNFSPTITSFLMATGLAALTYRYLGGIQGASFSVGTLKLGGAMAALVGIAWFIHRLLLLDPTPPSPDQDWVVNGQVVGEDHRPVGSILFPTDFTTNPSHIVLDGYGGFSLHVHSFPDVDGIMTFPTLYVTHQVSPPPGSSIPPVLLASPGVDLNPNATNPPNVKVSRKGHSIKIEGITLVAPAYAPTQVLKAGDESKPLPTSQPEVHQ
jgi:hypothetical protein